MQKQNQTNYHKAGRTRDLKVNPSKSSGPDNIPNSILKECAVQLAPILQKIFQVLIDKGDLPKDWRDANISGIFKKVGLYR